MPQVAAAALPAVLSYATGATLFGLSAAMTAGLVFVANIAMGFLAAALTPKPKIPNLSGFDVQARDRLQQFRQPITVWRTVYGETRISGPLTFLATTNDDKFLHMIITLCAHACEDIDTLYLGDDAISLKYDLNTSTNVCNVGKYSGKVRVFTNLGTTGSQPFPALASATTAWLDTSRQEGHTKIYVRLEHDRDVFPTQVPNLSVWIKGKKVADPRSASAVTFQVAPPLCLRDWLVTPVSKAGFGSTTLEINDVFTSAAANTSDEFVSTTTLRVSTTSVNTTNNYFVFEGSTTRLFTGDRVTVSAVSAVPTGLSVSTNYFYVPEQRLGTVRGGVASTYAAAIAGSKISMSDAGAGAIAIKKNAEPRYTTNGMVESDVTGGDIINDLLTPMGGRAVHASGKWRIQAAAYTAPTITFDEGDLISSLDIQTKTSRRDRFNAVKGVYVTTLNIDQPSDYPPITNATYEAEDNAERKYTELDLPFTNRPHTAQRLAKIALERHRQQISLQVTSHLKALQVQAGDTVMLTNSRLGWSAKVFEVSEWKLSVIGDDQPILGCEMQLRETASSVFDWNSGLEIAVDPAPNTNLPSAFVVVSPTNLVVSETLYDTRGSAGVKARAAVSWTAPLSQFVREYQLQYKLTSATTWTVLPNVQADTTQINIDDIDPGTYDFRVRAINQIGVRSLFATNSAEEIQGLLAPPTAAQNLTIFASGGLAILRWDRSTDLDVRIGGFINFRHSGLTTGATWSRSVTIGAAIPGSETVAVLPLKEGTYLARFVDSSGVYSDATSSVTTKQASIQTFTTVSTIQEHPTFVGSTTNCVVDTSLLKIAGSGLVDTIPAIDLVAQWDSYGGIVPSATYVFSSVFDFGAVAKRQLTTTVSVLIANASDTIDARTSNIDTWDSIDGDNSGDADCRVYMSQTDDDPTGAPTWGSYELLEAAEVEAWGVRFKAVLTSNDPVYNISVSKLAVRADSL